MNETVFQVEQAGCESCAALVREALEEVATVLEVDVDEDADLATVRLGRRVNAQTGEALKTLSEGDIDRLLRDASPEGHAYRVRPGSWRAA